MQRRFLTKRCVGFSSRPTANFSEWCSSFPQLLCLRCLQYALILRPLPLQWIAPTHQLINHQNRGNTVIPLSGTNELDPLCSSFAQAHLLSTWDILPPLWVRDVAFIYKLYLTSHTFWCVGVLHLSELCSAFKNQLCSTFMCGFWVYREINLWV